MNDGTGTSLEADRRRRQQAIEEIETAAAESEVFGTSSFVERVERAEAGLAGSLASSWRRTESWGRRTGRALSILAFFALLLILAVTFT